MDDLTDLWDLSEQRRDVAAVHESGHACFCIAIGGHDTESPSFTSVTIDEEPNEHGVVPGGVAVDPVWFERRSVVDRVAVLLAGWYAQEARLLEVNSGSELREAALDKLNDNSDCTDDIGRVLGLEPIDTSDLAGFWDAVLARVTHLWAIARPMVDQVAAALATRRVLSWEDVQHLLAEDAT